MADDSIILEILRRIQTDVAETRREVEFIKIRMSAFEDHLRGVMTTLAGIQSDLSQLNTRVDRIERRLDLVDA